MPRIYGVETEYGLVATTREDAGPRRLAMDDAAQRLFNPIVRANRGTNAFLPGGGRLYLDVGSHPEYATPECTSARDLVVAERAGDELLVRLAEDARARELADGRDTAFTLVKNNIDPYGNTYGSHENYLVPRSLDHDAAVAWLVPFLVSRQVIAGAGRWHRGVFTLSQRCDALADVVSNQTIRTRPLINTRDEPHADPARYRRLHVISGDSNLCEDVVWLKVVATELVLRLAEAGAGRPRSLDDPLAALRAWGRDPLARMPAGSSSVDALEVQRWYCERAAAVAGEGEASEGLAAWDAVLAGLASDPTGRGHSLEWARKRDLIEAWRDRHGVPDADARLDALDLDWHRLGEVDGRPAGLARLLEARGAFPRLSTPDAVAAALTVAPSPTRARLRGRVVAAAAKHGRDVVVDWASLKARDLPDGKVQLRLDDPFAAADPDVDALAARLASEPRVRHLGGFRPPPA